MREPTREQQRAADVMAACYGRSGVEPTRMNYATGSLVITGMTDDIERDKVIITTEGEVACCQSRDSDFVKTYLVLHPEFAHGQFRPLVWDSISSDPNWPL
jgi:hypothetical protein